MNTQQYLEQVRATTGFIDYRIAKDFGMQQTHVSKYNRGKLTLSKSHAFQFSKILKMRADKIIADTKLENAIKNGNKKKIEFWQSQVDRLNAEMLESSKTTNQPMQSNTQPIDYEQVAIDYNLSFLADKWYEYYGFNLKTGKKRLQDLQRTIKNLGDPKYSELSAAHFVEYCTNRIEKVKVKPRMVNYEMSILSTMITELRRMGYIKGNPLLDISKLKEGKMQTTFLELDELMMLLNVLKNSDIKNNVITFRDAKNGG